jgi:hypothetical protein
VLVTKTPIDLRAVAGKRYRVEYEESHSGKSDNPWLLIIPCQCGHIYPHSDKLLGVATDGRGSLTQKIARLPGVEVVQDGDDGINAVFPPGLFAKVAAIVKPKRKRQLTPEQRAINGKRLAKFAFKPAAQSARSSQNRPQTVPVDTLAV